MVIYIPSETLIYTSRAFQYIKSVMHGEIIRRILSHLPRYEGIFIAFEKNPGVTYNTQGTQIPSRHCWDFK